MVTIFHTDAINDAELLPALTATQSCFEVFDTLVQNEPAGSFADRPLGSSDNPKTAVWEYLKAHSEFEIDSGIDNKLLISVAPSGFLRRIR